MTLIRLIIGYWLVVAVAAGLVVLTRQQSLTEQMLRDFLARGDRATASWVLIRDGVVQKPPYASLAGFLVRRVFLWALLPFVLLMIVGALLR